jgi:NodT family efflux transporter outer membrane factor (OMF) lipoprotein
MRPFAIIVLLAGALQAAKPTPPAPQVTVPERFHNQEAGTGPIAEKWWSEFRDPLLDELIKRVATSNPDARLAAARVTEARAMVGQSRSALLPSVDASVTVNRVRGGINQGIIPASRGSSFVSAYETSVVSAGLQSRWEIDVFGGLQKQLRAAKADAAASATALDDVIRIARSELARNYIELRGYEEQIAIVSRQADSEAEMLDLIRARADAGLASQLDVEREQTQLATTRAALPALEAQRMQAAHRIAVLLGDEPGALLARLKESPTPLEVPAPPQSIPSEVLRRRPDLRRADAEIAAAYARAGSARADLYPKFSFTGQSGRQGINLAGLAFGAGNFFSVGPSISLPIFQGGRIKSEIAARDAQLEQAVRTYERDVLAAFEETENALVSRDRSGQRVRELEKAVTSARQSVDLARELYLRGLGDFLAVLDAQREQFQAERELALARTAVLRASVALYKSLGA